MQNSWTRLIERAKKFPILSLYNNPLKKSGKALIGKCILHDDTNPSLAFYENTNSYYCFTEGKGGDVINFFMEIKDTDFRTAVKALGK